MMADFDLIAYGFRWGPLEVERTCELPKGGYILTVRTEHTAVEVYVSAQGRVIKTFPCPSRSRKAVAKRNAEREKKRLLHEKEGE